MNKLYFVIMKNKEQIKNKYFSAKQKYSANGIDVGDYTFVQPEGLGISELWRAKEWVDNGDDKLLKFDVVYKLKNPIKNIANFVSLKLFVLNVNLLVKTHRPIPGSFAQLTLLNHNLDIVKNKDAFEKYLTDENNYRKLIICDNKNDINVTSEDVQIYKDENGFNLFPASFIDINTINKKFKNSNYTNGKGAGNTKGLLYKLISSGKKVITRQDCSLVGFYDLFISSNNTTKGKRLDFIEWCKNNGVARASSQYENGLRAIEKHFKKSIDNEFNNDECKNLLDKIKSDKKVIASKQSGLGSQRNWDSYLKKYIEFKKQGDLISNEPIASHSSEPAVNIVSAEMQEYLHSNTIFYGVPGCGKSYKISKLLSLDTGNKETELDSKFYKRILFHPEYTYSDFIGQVMPSTNGDRITYKFRPGPFVEILCDAINDEGNNYYLIIEEINRGNAPAIFGDVFQLLDRKASGESEYPIYNTEILSYFRENGIYERAIKIPANLTILATMNSCDQNVFTLDTAFKRRWRMSRIENNFEAQDQQEFLNTPIDGLKITWKQFAVAFNYDLLRTTNGGIIAEDKQLGTHFVSLAELSNIKYFAEKIFMYIWNDVVKYNKEQLFKAEYTTLDAVIKDFCNSKNVFNDSCEKMQKLYQELENSASNS